MEKIISDKFGCQVIEKNNKFFVLFDNGTFASKIVEYEITKDEAKKITISENDAYRVLLDVQERQRVKILKDYGWCQIIQQNNEYIIRYDGGGVIVQMKEIKVNRIQAEIALIDQMRAEQVIRELCT